MLMHNEENQTPSCLILEGKACGDNDVDISEKKWKTNPSESCGYKSKTNK